MATDSALRTLDTPEAMPRANWQFPSWIKMPSALAWIIGFGLVARIYHYLLNPGVWLDELYLLRNIVGKDYVELTGPLVCEQAAPPLFLWIERTVYLILGESTLAMRLVPLILSGSALFLVLYVARRCLQPSAVLWAMFLFACSNEVVQHTVEAKQYLTDVFVALLIPAVYFATKDWRIARRFCGFAFLSPLVIFASYPGCFCIGSLLLALLPEVWQNRRSLTAWSCYLLIVFATMAAFYALLIGPVRAQHTPELAGIWTEEFPDWARPWTAPWWTLKAFADGVDHSFRPAGMVFIPAAVLGCVVLWRRGLKAEMVLLSFPVILGLAAAWLHACPYHSRVVLYTTGPLALLIAEGTADFFQRGRQFASADCAGWRRLAWKMWLCSAIVLLWLPFGLTVVQIAFPPERFVFPWPDTPATWPLLNDVTPKP